MKAVRGGIRDHPVAAVLAAGDRHRRGHEGPDQARRIRTGGQIEAGCSPPRMTAKPAESKERHRGELISLGRHTDTAKWHGPPPGGGFAVESPGVILMVVFER